jgi:hypothetical protein
MGNGITHLSVGTSLTQAEYESTDAHVGGTGRTATYVVASATYGSAQEKAQADLVTDDGNTALTAALATFSSYTFRQPVTGTTYAAKQGTIKFGYGRFTFSDQVNIPSGYSLTIIGENPPSSLVGYYGTPRIYVGGTEFYFTGTTYPVLNAPLTLESYPSNPLSFKDIVFIVANPAIAQVNTVYAFNFDGWCSGTWDNVFFLTDTATLGAYAPPETYEYQNSNIKLLSIQNGFDHDRLQIISMTIFSSLGYAATFDADHLWIGTLTIGGVYVGATGDDSYMLCAKRIMTIDRLHLVWGDKGIYVPNTTTEPITINSMSIEGFQTENIVEGGGLVHIGNFQRRSGASIPSSLFSKATIDYVSYDDVTASYGYGGSINTKQNYGWGGKNIITQLLPILGDVKGLYPLVDNGSSTVVTDYSSYVNTATASHANTGAWGIAPLIKGCSSVYTMSSANAEYVYINDDDDFTFGNGTTDSPFTIVTVINPASFSSYGRCLMGKTEYSPMEWNLELQPTGFLHWGIFDQSENAWLFRNTPASTITAGNWYIIVCTYDGSGTVGGLKIYVNGVRVDNASDTGGSYVAMENTAARVGIGAYGNGNATIDGKQSWSIVTAKELSALEVWQVTQILKSALELP